jgi:murein DD-endopeptidase MepM/ murein hydrolase activator NlpD
LQTVYTLAEPVQDTGAEQAAPLPEPSPVLPLVIEPEPVPPPAPPPVPGPALPVLETALSGPRFALLPETVRPGEPVTIAYAGGFAGAAGEDGPEVRAVLINSQGTRLVRAPFFTFPMDDAGGDGEPRPSATAGLPGGEILAAVMGIPSTVEPGAFTVRVETAGGIVQDIPFAVSPRDFAAETIPLNQANTDLRTVPDPQKTRESEQLWAILSSTGRTVYTPGPFTPPVTSTRRTSLFGDRRVYRYADGSTDTSIHAGVDYGVPTGTEVRACAAGNVVLARPRIVTGNSVIIEHLPGVYSLYYHLDRIEVEEGAEVAAGRLIGLSGATGLATGPHLHWEIRAAGENTDPDAFVSRAVLDKAEILSKLRDY